jgi:hypothetical protein
MAKDELYIINQGLEMHTSASGKTRFTVRVVSEPIAINADPEFLAMAPAKRMAAFLKQRVLGITAKAPPNTIRARHTALKAFVQGKEWAMKRYSGGRSGSMPPLRSENAFNDSGRFGNGIAATKGKDGTWRVNVPANRLDESTSGGFERVWNRLVQLVPEFGSGIAQNIVAEGVKWSMQNMIHKGQATSSKLQLEVFKRAFDLVANVAELFAA